MKKLKRKLKRFFKRGLKNRTFVAIVIAVVACVGIIGYAEYMSNRPIAVDPTSYTKLLQLIGTAESKDNYNAYFGNANNTKIVFTDMTIAEVQAWQKNHIQQGNVSSAVGRYQIINTTLDSLVQHLGIDTTQKFNQSMQDTLAVALLERRGSIAYAKKELPADRFAANLAMEWASLPKIIGNAPTESYYAGDGINRALVSPADVVNSIEHIKLIK